MEKLKGYGLAILSAASYGLIPLFIIPIKQMEFSIEVTLFYRFLISALLVLPILLIKKESFKINRKEAGILILLGLFYAASSDFLFKGYDLMTPGIASTLLFIYPILVAFLSFIFFQEKLKGLTLLAMGITLAGVYVLSVGDSVFEINLGGLAVTVLAALAYALYIITVNKANLNMSGWKITFYSMWVTAIFFAIKSIGIGESLLLPNTEILFHFSLFALVTTVISTAGLVYAVKMIGSVPTSILGAFEPIVAVLVSVILFHESLTQSLLMGVLLIIIGVVAAILTENNKIKWPKRKPKIPKPTLPSQ